MKKGIINNCQWTIKLLLCPFILVFISCTSLRNADFETHNNLVLNVVIMENDIPIFIQRIHELNITIRNVKELVRNNPGNYIREFCISFGFSSPLDYSKYRFEILSTGMVKQIKNENK